MNPRALFVLALCLIGIAVWIPSLFPEAETPKIQEEPGPSSDEETPDVLFAADPSSIREILIHRAETQDVVRLEPREELYRAPRTGKHPGLAAPRAPGLCLQPLVGVAAHRAKRPGRPLHSVGRARGKPDPAREEDDEKRKTYEYTVLSYLMYIRRNFQKQELRQVECLSQQVLPSMLSSPSH